VRSLAAELIAQAAARHGLEANLEPTYRYVGQLVRPDGRRSYFRNTHFDLNGQGAAEMAHDKDYAAYFLSRLGYPVPEGKAFYSQDWARAVNSDRDVHAAYLYARSLGFPVIVKPNRESQGAWVARVHNRRELYRAMRAVFRNARDRVALVQRPVPGDDYRIVVLDGEVVAAYRRSPLAIRGDGRSTVAELLVAHAAELNAQGRQTHIEAGDYRINMALRRAHLTLASVPAEGEKLALLPNANLTTGGVAEDVTDVLHDGYRRLAACIAADMALRHCGIDIITRDSPAEPPATYTILEVNSAPGLDHFAALGPAQRAVVERMYDQIAAQLAAR
jgi:D-alanine-D-alanine ligase-like ATP-grasp enzyme